MAERDTIKNEIEKKHKRRKKDADEEKEIVVPKTANDIQRMQLERLMSDPEKVIEIPESRKKWQPRAPPEFVRHVMGSSAGAGSGEFHVYRSIRRREINRTNFIEQHAEEEKLNEDYHQKLESNKMEAESKTSRKRAKRQKKKQKLLLAKKSKKSEENALPAEIGDRSIESEGEDSESETEEEPHFVIGGK